MRLMRMSRLYLILPCTVAIASLIGCSRDSARNHYILGEKLWNEKNYQAAVLEFEKSQAKDRRGKLGTLALYRAAMTQALFLSEYSEAMKKLETFIQTSNDLPLKWEAKLQLGDLLFSKLEQYQKSLGFYQSLLAEKPRGVEVPEIRFRIAKSYFYLYRFPEALKEYEELANHFPKSSWAENAAYETAMTYLTWGEQEQADGKKSDKQLLVAKKGFENFIKDYPQSNLVAHARFGIASSLESQDRLEEAYSLFDSLRAFFPDPKIIEIKLYRIKERINHKKGKLRGNH